ncbi:MAG TPA: hypothetical protein VK543_12070 [Puia sp.]|nr:hypothetical protein [Puia sp.]
MSLNRIQLPQRVLADLFKHSLIVAEQTREMDGPEPAPGQPPRYKFLGTHQKKISLILASADHRFIPEHQLAFLTKMLEACKMTLADVAVLNHANNPIDIVELKKQLAPKIFILFGLEPKQIKLPFNSPTFKIQEYDDCTYLYAPPIEELTRDTEQGKLLKSKLWVCLRKLFEV